MAEVNMNKNEKAPEKRVVQHMENVSGVKRKKNNIRNVKSSLGMEEDVNTIKNYLIMDVVIPGIKKAMLETVRMFLYPNGNGPAINGSQSNNTVNYVSYSNRFGSSRFDSVPASSVPRTRQSTFQYDDIVFEDMYQAKQLLTMMQDVLDNYNNVSVADMLDIMQMPVTYTDNYYGWTDLSTVDVVRLRGGGYGLSLPPVQPLKR